MNLAVNLGSDKTGNVRVNVTMGRSRAHICSGTAVLRILSMCLLPYLPSMQCACALLYFHPYPVWLYQIFPHYLINGSIKINK